MISQRISELKQRIAAANSDGRDIKIVAVKKLRTPEQINTVLSCGITDIGENRVQHLLQKLPDINPAVIHLIGHLQSNKAMDAVKSADLIQSVDTAHILTEIDRCAAKVGKIQDVLLQVNIAHEQTKFGMTEQELPEMLTLASGLGNVRVKGLMAIMPIEKKEKYYRDMHELFLKAGQICPPGVDMDILSMGMSGDFEDAVANGATMVRVGTFIFS